jgi:hypothetical protein
MIRQLYSISKNALVILALVSFATFALAQKPAEEAVKFPDTPAGKTVGEFFAAFNSGNLETMRKFHQAHGGPEDNAEKDKEIFEKTGGLKVHSIKRSEKNEVEVLVQTKNDGKWLSFSFNVSGEAPFAIEGIRVQPTSAPGQ